MFAPSLGFAGHPVASVIVRNGPRGRALRDLIEQWGARLVTVTADQHDRMSAASQALTHAAVLAFGAALAELKVDITDLDRIAPPPHAALLSLLARIASGAPEVYWDVQAANPHAPAARRALAHGVSQLTDVVEDGDRAAFGDLLDRLRGVLGPLQGAYRERSAKALRAMTTDLTKEIVK
jgi:4-amino-4-deoxyprephenate dehydrogenase